ncbi:hypothetical protein [Peribacillus muralis]|uniref:hypothetical protein n=1 Tax=Peribacillus muralis TaxID=264697 RepID=UPI003D020B50
MLKNRFLVLLLLAVVFLFSSVNVSYAEETDDWDWAEFERLKLLDTIEFYGLDILQEEEAFEKNTTNEVIYNPLFEDGTTLEVKLIVTTDIDGNITAVESDASLMTMDILKKKKPKKPKTKKNAVPYKLNGGSNKASFINEHSYNKHKYDSKKKSSATATQYGKDVDVKKLREDTMANYEDKWTTTDKSNQVQVHYAKSYDSNISTKDTPTKNHRVVINKTKSNRSTQYPLSFKN